MAQTYHQNATAMPSLKNRLWATETGILLCWRSEEALERPAEDLPKDVQYGPWLIGMYGSRSDHMGQS